MAEITLNPLLTSINGSIGNLVLYKRQGKQYIRIRVIPRNPDTAEQRKGRDKFADAVAAWQALSVQEVNLWKKKASVMKRRGYNLFISEYMDGNTEYNLNRDVPSIKETTYNALFSCIYIAPLRSSYNSTPLEQVCSRHKASDISMLCRYLI